MQDLDSWQEIGPVSAIPKRGARVVVTALGPVAVFRTGDDQIFALEDRCPHKGGPLSQGIVHGAAVACPLHNWRIDLGTGQAVAPDHGCAKSVPVRVEGGMVLLPRDVAPWLGAA